MGHDVAAESSMDFVVTLQRGTEWAATGKVTQKIPADFPMDETTMSTRMDLMRMDPAYNNGQPQPANAGGGGAGRGGRATGPAPVFTNGRITADQITTATLSDGTVVTRQPDGSYAPVTPPGAGPGGRRGGGPGGVGGPGGAGATPPASPCE
jgi:hypothetical protein